jgi:prefoldin alpha subunit
MAADKITKFEEFLNEKLAIDLKQIINERDSVYQEIANYMQLKNVLIKIREGPESVINSDGILKTMVDLGGNMYARARIRDTSRVIVCIGMGFYLEMELLEALTFIETKTKQLNDKIDRLNKNASEIQARMELVLEGIKELNWQL